MTKKDYLALGDRLRSVSADLEAGVFTTPEILYRRIEDELALFFRADNPAFRGDLWRNYVAGKCGPNGGRP